HPDALAASMWAAYGDSAAGFRRRGVPCREVAAMAAHLPAGAPVQVAANPQAAWSQTDWLLADLVDATRETTWTIRSMLSKRRPPRPSPYPRPQAAAAERWLTPTEGFDTPAEFMAWRAARLHH
ncbi:MAG: hypothetical protein LBE08_11360, partial [Bifidobacteriaceae bacterium]|nr:hypothetical protein [Bifidobacteriaceae bacterium]